MKSSLLAVLVVAVMFAPSAPAAASDGKTDAHSSTAKAKASPAGGKAQPADVTLKGQLTCAKCGLHESSVCQSVLRVSDPTTKSETKYYLTKNDVAQAHHEQVCGGQVNATVTGRVSSEGGKKILTASTITVN